jgi:hypothetical protein
VSGRELDRPGRIRGIVGAVARQALHDRACDRLALLDDGSPEARLAIGWLGAELGPHRLIRVAAEERQVESLLQILADAGVPPGAEGVDWPASGATRIGLRRLIAGLVPGALVANPANKTALLLAGAPPPDPFFPLGDLYASEVAALAGGWSAPAEVEALARACGSVDLLDDELRRRIDQRDPLGTSAHDGPAARAVAEALAKGRAARVYPTIVPKVGSRTLGVDLFE